MQNVILSKNEISTLDQFFSGHLPIHKIKFVLTKSSKENCGLTVFITESAYLRNRKEQLLPLLIHQCTHVIQYLKHSWTYSLTRMCQCAMSRSFTIRPDANIAEYTLEQQANIMESYYRGAWDSLDWGHLCLNAGMYTDKERNEFYGKIRYSILRRLANE